jgi:RND family efflux transporter MFP subunit
MTTSSDLSTLRIDRSARLRRHGPLRGNLVRLFLVTALVGVGLAAWVWRQHGQLTVQTAVVSMVYPSQALTLFSATGYLVAQRRASVASKASGRLEWLGVLEGSEVRAGEVIARLENGDTQALRDQAAANVQLAEANLGYGNAELSEAELVFRRSEALASKKLVSDSAHDSAVARLGKARAAVAGYEAAVSVARANLRVAEVALEQTFIRAPFDGVVLARNANLGDTITPFSQSVEAKGAVVTMADMDTLEVEADVAEASLLSIRVGQSVEIQLESIPSQRFEGVVARIVPTVDRAKASTLVKSRFVNRDLRMLPEMSARVAFLERELTQAERRPVLAVAAAAVFDANGSKQVYVVEDGKARMRRVDLGAKLGDQIEVRGLEAGTRVIIRPLEGLADGRAVKEGAK